MFSLNSWRKDAHWKNWSGYEVATPAQKLLPKSYEELQHIVLAAKKNHQRIRVTGAGHSFSAVAKPEEIAISLHYLRGIVAVDKEKSQVTLRAGTYLHEIGPLLRAHGLAIKNMGDVQHQTIAGAISTATHGTGISLGSVAEPVVKWVWIDGNGEIHSHTRGDDDLSNALHLSLGMLGILVEVTLEVMPLYGLKEHSCIMSFDEGLAQLEQAVTDNRHMEWFLFPGTNKLQQKTLTIIPPKAMSKMQHFKDGFEGKVVLNGVFYLMSEYAKRNHRHIRTISRISAANIPNTKRQGYCYEVFPKPRGVVFDESEYFVDYDRHAEILTHFNDALMHDVKKSHFPIEVRTHKGESGFLSPTQGKDKMVLSFHVYRGIPSAELFDWLKTEMLPFDGRPHWGKVNKLSHAELRDLYPDMDKFLQQREKYDPERVFLNKWLTEKFLGE